MSRASRQPMYYAELVAAAEIAPWVASHWHFRVEPGAGAIEHTIPLTGGAMLVVTRGGEPLVAGPRVTPFRTTVRGGDVVWGSHFWPGAAGSLFATSGAELRERVVPVRLLVGDALAKRLTNDLQGLDDEARATHVLDAIVSELASTADPLDALVMTAVFRIMQTSGRAQVASIARSLGISPRQLRRRMRAAAGLSSKELARIRRFRASALELVGESRRTWVDIAATHGYADQAHLVREFRSLLGLTPTDFDDQAKRIEHGRLEP